MPDSGTPRRTRLRLARQRPGPNRIRGRERSGEADAEVRTGRLNLLTIGAVVTIAATIGSLVTTGIGTLWSARVAADQLAQSREQDEDRKQADLEKLRAQASRISVWADRTPDGKSRIHLMNRSPDPVNQVFVAFAMEQVGDAPGLVSFAVRLDSLPPCSDSLIEQKTLRWSTKLTTREKHAWELPGFLGDGWASQGHFGVPRIEGIAFSDRDGIGWLRQHGRLSSGSRVPLERVRQGVEGRLASEPVVQSVESCGDGAGS